MILESTVKINHYDFIVNNNDDYLTVITLASLLNHYPDSRILVCLSPVYTTINVDHIKRGIYTFFDDKLALYVFKNMGVDLRSIDRAWCNLCQKRNIDVLPAHLLDVSFKLHPSEQTQRYQYAYPFLPLRPWLSSKERYKKYSRLKMHSTLTLNSPSFHKRSCTIKDNQIKYYKGLIKMIRSLFVPKCYMGFSANCVIHTGLDRARHLEQYESTINQKQGLILGRRHLKANENLYEKRLHDIAAALMINELIQNQVQYQAYRCGVEYDYYRSKQA
ncbi:MULTISPECIES: hypothetical protein [Cysteiniphilum]|uniref:Uncharacterized protein n=1 Tax=Cysteiniphilum litorale TaxID=2056700 RepID=A0A8J2Z374_9GAMM|nr:MULTISPECIES: hypothetical protein [Cysteiniphilum]GGF92671.1 hypothetical protein GCM10010995_07280 [Cysteiniphilum litorale]